MDATPRGKSVSTACPAWLLSRSLCCVGIFALMQNAMLLHWGSMLLQDCSATSDVSPPVLAQGASSLPASIEHVEPARLEQRSCECPTCHATPTPAQACAACPHCPAAPAPTPCPSRAPAALPTALPHAVPNAKGGSNENQRLDPLTPIASVVSRDQLRVFGKDVPAQVRLCVGFGTVQRQKDYVLQTIGNMLGLTPEKVISSREREQLVVVAHLADFDVAWVNRMADQMQTQYPEVVDAGRFHGIHAPEEHYPLLDFCPPFCSYNDEPRRVKWRSKQNVDYAFLMYYAAPLAPLYLQLEDDLHFASSWVNKVLSFVDHDYPLDWISKENTPWRLIDFSELGFIGKLFQSKDLLRMAQFLLLFYDQMPCDILVGQWMKSMTQGKRIDYWKKYSSLFQHMGVFRSFGGFQPLQERKFGKLLFNNPPGTVLYNMTVVPTYDARFPYFVGGEPEDRNDVCDFQASPANQKSKIKKCWFWAKALKANDHLTVVFDSEVPIKAVFIEFSELPHHPQDLLLDGEVQVAGSSARAPPKANPGRLEYCGRFASLQPVKEQQMVYWEEGASTPEKLPVPQARCLRITALRAQQAWCIIMQIQVRTE